VTRPPSGGKFVRRRRRQVRPSSLDDRNLSAGEGRARAAAPATPLAARNFPSAEEEAAVAESLARYAGPESAFRLASSDTGFLLRDERRPVRMQPELLKAELVQKEQGIDATIVIFGSARIVEPEQAAKALVAALQGDDAAALQRAQTAVAMSPFYDEAWGA
jgi:hypothetical protein